MPNAQAQPPKLLARLPAPVREAIGAPPVAPVLWPRRVLHMAAGATIPIAALYLADSFVLWALISLTIGLVLIEAARLVFTQANQRFLRLVPFFKPSERHVVTGATFMLLSATFVFLLFDKEAAVLAMLFLAVGDPMAALVGSRAHRGRIFGKSLAGGAAFLVCAGAAGLLATLSPGVSLAWWFLPGLAVATVAELLPIPLDDNVTVPIAGAATMHLLAMV